VQKINDWLRKFAGRAELIAKGIQLGVVREFSMPEEVNRLLKAGVPSDFVDVVAGINEDSLLTENITEAG
jgi:hypothetical protein